MSDSKSETVEFSTSHLRSRPKDISNISINVSTAQDSAKLEKQTRTNRLFSFAHLFAFSLTYMSTWEAILLNMYYSLYNGGPRTFLIWFFVVFLGALGQSASLAEMASLQPIAGAQYHWTWALSTGRFKRIATWIQGWTTWFAYVSVIAGCTNVAVILLEAMIAMNNPSYVVSGWKTCVISISMCIFQGFLNTHAFQIIPYFELMAGVLHVSLFVIYVVVLAVMGTRNPASFIVSTNYSSGWENPFVASNVGMLSLVWCFTAHEGVIHMGEEARKSKVDIPRASFWSIFMNGCLAFIMVIMSLVAMGPVEDVLNASSAIQEIVFRTTGSTGATTAMLAGVFIICFNVNLASIASTSRLTWAWARDGGLPSYFSYVAPKQRVPIRAVALVTFIDCMLSLLNIESTAYIAYGAIAALSALACYISYAIAVGSMLHARWNARAEGGLKLGEWNLGRYGVYINIWALMYSSWAIIFLPFPSTIPVTATNMNYSGPVMGFVLLVAMTLWFAHARKHWPGPNISVIDIVLANSKS